MCDILLRRSSKTQYSDKFLCFKTRSGFATCFTLLGNLTLKLCNRCCKVANRTSNTESFD